jgi:hypothetical protein
VRRRWKYLPVEVRREIIRLAAAGATRDQIRLQVDVAIGTVSNVLRPLGGVIRRDVWDPSAFRLSLDERVEILVGLEAGRSFRLIGAGLGRSPSTVSREVTANGGRGGYAPV